LRSLSRRKPGSIVEQRDAAKWIPAFAGMTTKGSWPRVEAMRTKES
jgi:hypothetical protein